MPPRKKEEQEEARAQPADFVATSPDPDGSNYVLKDVDHETVVGYQEQVHKDDA